MFHADEGPDDTRPLNSSHWFSGLSIALVITVCLAAFVVAYVEIDPYLSDFVSENDTVATPASQPTTTEQPSTPVPTPTPDGTPEGHFNVNGANQPHY